MMILYTKCKYTSSFHISFYFQESFQFVLSFCSRSHCVFFQCLKESYAWSSCRKMEFTYLFINLFYLYYYSIISWKASFNANIFFQMQSCVGSELTYILSETYAYIFEPMLLNLERKAASLGINSYGISLTTLEDVFMRYKCISIICQYLFVYF